MLSVVHHQDVFNRFPSGLAENPYTWPESFSFDWQTDHLSEQHLYPDVHCPSWTFDNALGMSNMYGSESVPTTEQTHLSTPFSHQLPAFDGLAHHGQPSAPHNEFVYQGHAFTSAQDICAPRLDDAVSPHESSLVRKPTLRSRRDRGRTSRLLGLSTADSRHAPYLLDTRKRDTSARTYHCHWNDDGTYLCGAAVVGTKASIWRHLHEVHAIQLNADKTMQACMWETCGKVMRRESVARHILTVHFHDKVECPSCRTHFARRDSLQRHQRSCVSREEATPQDACTVALGDRP